VSTSPGGGTRNRKGGFQGRAWKKTVTSKKNVVKSRKIRGKKGSMGGNIGEKERTVKSEVAGR